MCLFSDRYGTMLYRAYVQERPKRTPFQAQQAEFRGITRLGECLVMSKNEQKDFFLG